MLAGRLDHAELGDRLDAGERRDRQGDVSDELGASKSCSQAPLVPSLAAPLGNARGIDLKVEGALKKVRAGAAVQHESRTAVVERPAVIGIRCDGGLII